MKRYLLIAFVAALWSLYSPVHAQSDSCLSPHIFGRQPVRVVGSIDAGGMPFRFAPSLSQPVQGFIPLDTTLTTTNEVQLCVEGRNWYVAIYPQDEHGKSGEVWITDGDGQSYWLEPIPLCTGGTSAQVVHIFPSYPAYYEGLIVDGYDPATGILRFSAQVTTLDKTPEQHYFNFDSKTAMITETDYWYQDIITHRLTDKLGITEQVFGEGEDFSTLYVSPDRTKILYRVRNPTIPDCAHGCSTETLWLANADGSNPISLSVIYGDITRVIWGNDGKIYLSLAYIEVAQADFTLTLCMDGSCAIYDNETLLAGRSLPFDYVQHMPTTSPDGKWIALSVGSNEKRMENIEASGIILNSKDDRYIELPYNGGAAASILWLDDDTILYPVIGLGWKGEDYGLPKRFYEHNALWEIHLDFDKLTYRIGDEVTDSLDIQQYEDMFDTYNTKHIILGYIPIIYSPSEITVYCFSHG